MKKILALILALAMVVSTATIAFGNPETPAFDQEVKLTLATTSNPGSLSALMVEDWINMVTERSGGKIVIDYQPSAVLGSEADGFQQVMDGVIEACCAGLGTYCNFNRLPEVFQLPFLVSSYDVELAALKSPEWAALVDVLEESIGSVYIYGCVEVGMRHIFSKKPITKLEDMKGLKIRTASSTALMEAMELLGANPIITDSTEVYSAFANGIVDALDMNYTFGVFQKHYEVGTDFTEVGSYPFPVFVCFNKDFIDSLPQGYWDFMKACMDEAMERYFTETIVGADDDNRAILEANGVTIHTLEDPEAWHEALQPMYEEYLSADNDQRVIDFVNAVEEIKAAK